ncbi:MULTISPECIES: hypothetical protein [Aequorivita]|uniref:Uncharacterized protein n=1 Tax=Aequorivita iocasae TaxID=2803865 RepID=A0ABX7DR12_9FLAO|nr:MULTISPECIES: hypothetical protein [Aequorivita]QQX76581.1 hypothetical protein JK629_14840 [Aequorivita iocasae]UCA56052.1 hypothetical protein LDL78_14910 [Aequorivita sp. F7]
MKHTLINLTKLRIAGMLSEAARQEVEQKILEIPEEKTTNTNDPTISFG